MILGSQGKLGKTAESVACYARERPRTPIQRRHAGPGRLIETTLLVLAGLLLTVAVVNDVVEQTHVNHRLIADLHTWREYTGHDYINLSTAEDIYGHTTRDIVCGNTSPGPPGERTQLCLQLTGPVLHGRRAARGGWYLPPKTQDAPALRYGCFGSAESEQRCGPAARGSSENPEAATLETGP